MPGWKFLTNHTLVLFLIAQQPRITAREVSAAIGITEKATRNIIDDLENEGYLSKKKEGRRLNYTVAAELSLRAETQQDRTIGELLRLLGWKRRSAR